MPMKLKAMVCGQARSYIDTMQAVVPMIVTHFSPGVD
jgi:hypothetical protein